MFIVDNRLPVSFSNWREFGYLVDVQGGFFRYEAISVHYVHNVAITPEEYRFIKCEFYDKVKNKKLLKLLL